MPVPESSDTENANAPRQQQKRGLSAGMWSVFIFGIVGIVTIVVATFLRSDPTRFQSETLRIVLALSGAGVAIMLPTKLRLGRWLQSSAGLLVFGVIYFFHPAIPAAMNPASLPPTSNTAKITISNWIGFAPIYLAAKDNRLPHWQFTEPGHTSADKRKQIVTEGLTDAWIGQMDERVGDVMREGYAAVTPTCVLVTEESTGGDAVIARPPINSFEQLRGKRVASWAGSSADLVLGFGLAEAGLGFRDVSRTHIDSPARLVELFVNNRVDAIAVWSPYLEQVAHIGNVLRRTMHGQPPNIFGCLFLRDTTQFTSTERRGLLFELFSGWDYGVGLLRTHGDAIDSRLASWLNLPASQVKVARNNVVQFTVAESTEDVLPWNELLTEVHRQVVYAGLETSGKAPSLTLDTSFALAYKRDLGAALSK